MNYLYLLFLSAALVLIECLIGGTRLLFSFPSYALLGVIALFSVVSIRRPIPRPGKTALITAFFLAGYVLIRAWRSPVPYLAWPDAYMAAGCLIVYLLTALYLTEARHRFWVVGALLVLAVAEVGVGAVQYTRENGFMLFGFIRDDVSPRASGMFISGNHFAGYLEAVAILAVSLACWSRCRLPAKLAAGCVALLCYGGVAISGSRGGYISATFSILVFAGLSLWILWLIRPKRVLLPALGGLAVLLVVFAAAATLGARSELVRKRFSMIGNKDVRIYNWAAALDQFRLAPWRGTGAGTHLIYGRLFRRPQIQTDPVHAHSDYLEMLAEYGIIGEGLAFLFLGAHLLNGLGGVRQIALRRLRDSPVPPRSDTLALGLGAVCATAALVSHSVVDFNMHIPGNALLFAFIFGMLANPGADRTDLNFPLLSPITFLRLILPAMGIALIAAVLPRFEGERLTEHARIALRDKNYSKCIPIAKRAIAEEPQNPNPWFYLGEANRMMALAIPAPPLRKYFFKNAVEAYRGGLRHFPQDENLLVRLGQSLDGMHQFEEADQAYLDAIQWDPGLGLLYAYYGAHFRLLHQKEAADRCYEAARRLGSGAAASVGMAEAHSILQEMTRGPRPGKPTH